MTPSSSRAPRPSFLVFVERPVVDLSVWGDHLPGSGEKTVVRDQLTRGGGVGGNFAAMTSSLGCRTSTFGIASRHPLAGVDEDSLLSCGVDTHWFGAGDADPIVCYIFVDNQGSRTVFIHYPKTLDSEIELVAKGFAKFLELSQDDPQHFYLGVLRSEVAPLAHAARNYHVPLICTLEHSDWPTEEAQALLQICELVFCADETYYQHESEVRHWQSLNNFDLVVTHGAQGSMFMGHDGDFARSPAIVGQSGVVDTSGAGDAFAAAFSADFFANRNAEAALKFAASIAGDHVGVIGARTQQSRRDDSYGT